MLLSLCSWHNPKNWLIDISCSWIKLNFYDGLNPNYLFVVMIIFYLTTRKRNCGKIGSQNSPETWLRRKKNPDVCKN